jgi:hypothetical protein
MNDFNNVIAAAAYLHHVKGKDKQQVFHLLFYSNALHLMVFRTRLHELEFEAGRFGPAVREIDQKFEFSIQSGELPESTRHLLDYVCEQYPQTSDEFEELIRLNGSWSEGPNHGRERSEGPNHGRERSEGPNHGRERSEGPNHGRERSEGPNHVIMDDEITSFFNSNETFGRLAFVFMYKRFGMDKKLNEHQFNKLVTKMVTLSHDHNIPVGECVSKTYELFSNNDQFNEV